MSEESVVALMKSSKSAAEWDANCDKVKVACHGYPSFWFKAVIMSGILNILSQSPSWRAADAYKSE